MKEKLLYENVLKEKNMAVMNNKQQTNQSHYSKRNVWSGFLFGVGIAAFIDEVVFHLILQWHHFYDKSTLHIGLLSDGIFHAFGWFATIGGSFLLADVNRRHAFAPVRWWGGVLIGLGGFQLYDGTVHHKVMQLHQIRYVDNLIIYDLVWNILAIIMLLIGLFLVFKTRSRLQTVGSVTDEQP